jgi:integrase
VPVSAPQKVQVFAIGSPPKGTPTAKRRYRVKWRIDGRDRTRAFKTRAEADRYRRLLLDAVSAGELFDDATGEPMSWNAGSLTWFAWSQQWLSLKWPQWAGTTRKTAVETLATITPLMVRSGAPDPPADLVTWLRSAGYLPAAGASATTPAWLERWSVPLHEITPALLEQVLTAATTRQDGRPVTAAVARRRKNSLGAVLRAAVRRDLIDRNPMDRVEWRTPSRDMTLDVATVASVADVIAVVDHVAELDSAAARYAALFACVGLAGLRPSEAIGLRRRDLELPATGWGLARVRGATTEPGARYTDDGDRAEVKGLKHRATGAVREVPLPPMLVERLRAHLEQWPDDEHLFRNVGGRPMTPTSYNPVWRRARAAAWGDRPELASTTVYDLRHAAATMMLQAGVPPAEVARRLGHSIDILLRVYAGVLVEERDRSNELIDRELERLGRTASD